MNIPFWTKFKASEDQKKSEWRKKVVRWDAKIETVEGSQEFLNELANEPLSGYAVKKILKTLCSEVIALKKEMRA